jgi:hypothetical protein
MNQAATDAKNDQAFKPGSQEPVATPLCGVCLGRCRRPQPCIIRQSTLDVERSISTLSSFLIHTFVPA